MSMSGDSEVRCAVVTIHSLFVLMPVVIFLVVRDAICKLGRRVWANPLRRPLRVVYLSLRFAKISLMLLFYMSWRLQTNRTIEEDHIGLKEKQQIYAKRTCWVSSAVRC